MGQDVVGAKSIARQCEISTVHPRSIGADAARVTPWRQLLGWVACVTWLGMSATGCRLTSPNAPPVLATHHRDVTQIASQLKPQTSEPLAAPSTISNPSKSPSPSGMHDGQQFAQVGFAQSSTGLNADVPIVRGQSPQSTPTQPPSYLTPAIQTPALQTPALQTPGGANPNTPNAATAGGGNSYRAPMQATDASQFNAGPLNRYAQPLVPGASGQQLGQPTIGSLPGPPNYGSLPTSPPTTVYQPQLPVPSPYNTPPNNALPYSNLGPPPVYGQTSPSDYGATIAPGAIQGPGTGDTIIAPGVVPYVDPNFGFDPTINAPGVVAPGFDGYRPRQRIAPIDVYVQEARTGRIIVGGSVNSDLGVAGQIVVDERNFNIRRLPRSWDDLWSGRAFRGGGQNFRMELMPGSQVERYTVSWTERNLFGYLPYSLSVGGFYFTRQYRDWIEQRLGGRVALGYEVTKDLAISGELRMEDVKIFSPRVDGVQELDSALGSNDIYTARFRVTHDTRDSPFLPTRGALLELDFDQVFGEYDFSRGGVNYARYFMVRERPDGTGRHTIATSFRFGVTGSQTPIFENYFAGGYSTMRGFSFRGASPVVNNVQVGGELQLLGSVEYMMPLTADEMLRGVAFVDYGTVEQNIEINSENFRVAPGLGLRISVPALGPAPLAFDFAVPLNYAETDDRQVLSFFMGFTR